MSKQPTLDDLFHDTLKDIYFAEKKLVATLPKMAKAAQHPQLKAFESHLKETEGHVQRLERVFAIIGKKPVAKTCDAIVGITKEGAEIVEDYKGGPGARCRPDRRRASRRALRDLPLRHLAHLGRGTGAAGCRRLCSRRRLARRRVPTRRSPTSPSLPSISTPKRPKSSTTVTVRRLNMDWNRIEGDWKRMKGSAKERWGRLTDDDLAAINGRREPLGALAAHALDRQQHLLAVGAHPHDDEQ